MTLIEILFALLVVAGLAIGGVVGFKSGALSAVLGAIIGVGAAVLLVALGVAAMTLVIYRAEKPTDRTYWEYLFGAREEKP